MKVTAPRDCYLPAVKKHVAAGEVVDVPDDVGRSLVDQGWSKPATSKKESDR